MLSRGNAICYRPSVHLSVCHTGESVNKKAVLSQRWPRDARHISRSWAVAEIWSFEIIQDGGGRHLEFIRIENSAIGSAVPENPTLKQKHEVDRTTGCGDMATWNFSNMAVAAILDLFES